MKLELVLPRDQYLLGEQISLDVRLTNTGTAAVDAPYLTGAGSSQPVYKLRGPSYPNGVSFSFRDTKPARTEEEPDAAVPAAESGGYHLEAGAMMEDGFTLSSLKPIGEAGEYTVSATIQGKGWSAEAAPLRFRVEKATFLDAAMGVDVFTESTRTLRAVWTADTERGRLLGESFFYENRPDIAEVRLTGTRIIRGVGPKASDAFCPWINYDRSEASKFWHGWREGGILYAFSDDEAQPRTFDMGSAKARMVRPALMNKAGDLDVVVLAENRTTLRLIRFPHTEGAQALVVWSAELPEPVTAMGVGMGPAEQGGARVALSVWQAGLKLGLRAIRLGEKAAEIGPPSVLDNAFVLADSEPSVHIAPDGTVRAAMVVAKHPGLRTLAVAELMVRASGETTATVAGAERVDAAVARGWSAQTVTAGNTPSTRWLVRLSNGAALLGGKPLPVTPTGPAVDLLRMSAVTYVLVVDANRGPRLVPAEF